MKRLTALPLLVLLAGCGGGEPPLQIFAAASLGDVLEEAGRAFEQRRGLPVSGHYAGSNTLVRQLLARATADLLVVADPRAIEPLAAAGLVEAGSMRTLLVNRLVVVAPRGSRAVLAGAAELLQLDRLAIADPQLAPAGAYAREWLEKEGLWEQLEERVVPMLDVRAALATVAAGHLPAGVVYASDAAADDRVQVIYQPGAASAPEIRYVAAPLVGCRGGTLELLDFLTGDEGARLFRRFGFEVAR